MSHTTFLSPADAARRLGVSAKALRLYEERGLLAPGRTAAGWRAYGPDDMTRAAEIAALRGLGLSLAQVERAFTGHTESLEAALAAHQAVLEAKLGETAHAIGRVRDLRTRVSRGDSVGAAELAGLLADDIVAAFDLPWPWGGERFELRGIKPLTWIVGPLFSGKTQLAIRLADAIPGAMFVGLEREAVRVNAAHGSRMDRTLAWLMEDGATLSDALEAVVGAFEMEGPTALIFDLIEQGLDAATQVALAAWLRARADRRPVFAMTRSSAMLDLSAVKSDEALIFCPANHSPPVFVAPWPGAPGYEATANCLGSPEVRARSEGIVAMRAPAG